MQAPSPSSAPRSILVDMPRGTGPHPAVVLAPGVGYHLRMPLMEAVKVGASPRWADLLLLIWCSRRLSQDR